MSLPVHMISETKKREGARAFLANLIPLLSLLVIGYPLARTTISAMLLGWALMVTAIMQSMLRHSLQTIASVRTVRSAPVRSADYGRYGR